jgi:hypothetical protein
MESDIVSGQLLVVSCKAAAKVAAFVYMTLIKPTGFRDCDSDPGACESIPPRGSGWIVTLPISD